VVAMNRRVALSQFPKLALVLHYRYGGGAQAVDLSGYNNHGRVVHRGSDSATVEERTTAASDGLRFDGLTTRVVVPPSPSLQSLGAVRIDAQLLLEAGKHRRTIVEGFLAMSFFVEPDNALAGTVYTGHRWYGAYSRTGIVPTGRLINVSFLYDGLTTSILQIDGRTVALAERPLGPVRSVEWPFGLNVGAWPDGDRRMFRGIMYELKIWRARTPGFGLLLP
jgi:hypothetical protein